MARSLAAAARALKTGGAESYFRQVERVTRGT
ncbi:hypothetical protein P873_05975 [Arenimonas composti TR7-09 = DSM 18010]|uniref:Uncharacterized protein n=1 Tax=Arenimonas composti TR7-09 = DSM 18010 TaxID=1121013 RepID=A0A091BDE6_9GAMM|nr:hypothetical protein P873_05975 [Arenimonas composti TR7-09 = DSM 18010]